MIDNDKFINAMQAIPFPDTTITVDSTNAGRMLENKKLSVENTAIVMEVFTGVRQSAQIEIETSWTWRKALNIMLRLEGLNKNESTHAAGVVVAPVIVEENVPLMRKDGDTTFVCQYDMKSIEALGYLKMDVLGLRTVDVNYNAGVLVRNGITRIIILQI